MIRVLTAGETVHTNTFVVISYGARTAGDASQFDAGLRTLLDLHEVSLQDGATTGAGVGAAIGADIAGRGAAPITRQVYGRAKMDFVSDSIPRLAGAGIVYAAYGLVVDDVQGAPVITKPSARQVAQMVGTAGGEFIGDVGGGLLAGLGLPPWLFPVLLGFGLLIAVVILLVALKKALK